ncbi:hypothetical protein RIF29_08658 [Crotalaria pallida]|uniref:Uncharacterized protein n=1 Tax=Crotalaria pallida TaxID=3830 RepID=A0AAN9FXI7_CROPI
MANHKTPFKHDVESVAFIKPPKPTPSSILSLSHIDNRPDCDGLAQIIYAYQPPPNHEYSIDSQLLDPVFMIKEALSKALLYYYPLAGRLVKHADGNYRIHFDGDCGVPFLEAVANCNLSSLHYFNGNETETAKHFAFNLPPQDQNGHQYPLVFKVTKFLCGGFTIAIGTSHVVVDGFGASQFSRAMAELASGKSEPSVKPVWERERLMGSITKQPFQCPIDVSTLAVSPFLPTTTLMHGCFKLDCQSITRLKLNLMKESVHETMEKSFTTFEALGAYVWRSRAKALKLSYEGSATLMTIVGIRGHFDPPLPDGYYGNAFVDPYTILRVKDLIERPLSEIAKLIRESNKYASTRDYVTKSINTIYPSLEEVNIYGDAITVLTDWRHLGFMEKMDFGGNKLVNAVPDPCGMFGSESVCVFSTPSPLDPSMKGGVQIFVSLPSGAMVKFEQEMEALRQKSS